MPLYETIAGIGIASFLLLFAFAHFYMAMVDKELVKMQLDEAIARNRQDRWSGTLKETP